MSIYNASLPFEVPVPGDLNPGETHTMWADAEIYYGWRSLWKVKIKKLTVKWNGQQVVTCINVKKVSQGSIKAGEIKFDNIDSFSHALQILVHAATAVYNAYKESL